jgi:hypothetical protein
MLPIGQTIYRARLLGGNFTNEQLDKNPAKELSAPPKDIAKAGHGLHGLGSTSHGS